MKAIFTFVLLSLFFNFTAHAGTGTRGGGEIEPFGMNSAQVRFFIQSKLKNEVKRYFEKLDLASINNTSLKQSMATLKNGINLDLGSRYVMNARCLDQFRIERQAATENGTLKGDICFDLTLLTRAQVTSTELIALAVHEHARHFSLEDQTAQDNNNPILKFVSDDFELMTYNERLISGILSSSEYMAIKVEVESMDLMSLKLMTRNISRVNTAQGQQCKGMVKFEAVFAPQQKYLITQTFSFLPKKECFFRNLQSSQVTYAKE